MNQFYITLPSDSSSRYYENNTVARYRTKLPERVSLEGDYLVGLSEFIYPRSWYNVDNSKIDMWFGLANREKYTIEAGYYSSFEQLLEHVKVSAQELLDENSDCNALKLVYKEISRKIYMQVDCMLHMSNPLANLLGLRGKPEGHHQVFAPGWYKSTSVVDIDAGYNLMYVYCDIVTYTSVGDTKAPLLAVVPTSGRFGQTVREVYTDPHYVPVQRKDFDTIEIAINNEEGRPMPFEFGKSVVKLHFRRANPLQ